MQNSQNKCLEICCYVCGAGAFGVFLRWLQDQMAFNEAGLAEKSVFHVLVPAFILAMALVFLRFVDRARNARFYLPEDVSQGLENSGKLFTAFRYVAGGLMCLGALVLFVSCEADKNSVLIRVLALTGLLSGLAYPLLLAEVNKPERRQGLLCLLSVAPVLMFAVWLVVSYKMNDINSVVWSYFMEMLAVIVAMLAFFYIAGFFFGVPSPWRSMFFSMAGAALCVMALADERYLGMHMMFMATAVMLAMYNWIMFKNLLQGKPQPKVQPEDGFERLNYAPAYQEDWEAPSPQEEPWPEPLSEDWPEDWE